MTLPVNIDDIVNYCKVEWARIEYKEEWNPEKVFHSLCALGNCFIQFNAKNVRELNPDDAIIVLKTDPVPYQLPPQFQRRCGGAGRGGCARHGA